MAEGIGRRSIVLGLSASTMAMAVAGARCDGASAHDAPPLADPATPSASLDKLIRDAMPRIGLPGLAVSRLRAGQPTTTNGYGCADLQTRQAVDADSIFHVASVSKVVTATAVMLLWQDGLCDLDEEVAPHLDFPLAAPDAPARPITVRHLLTHTSGLSDRRYESVRSFADKQGRIPSLAEFLRSYLTPDGALGRQGQCWNGASPGQKWDYSNVGFALLGYLVQRLSGQPFEAFTRERLFAPLGMPSTAWFPSHLPAQRIVTPYAWHAGRWQRLPASAYPDWPAGSLRTSARDFSRFLRLLCEGGLVGQRRLIQPRTLAEMLAPQAIVVDPDDGDLRQALGWVLRQVDGRWLASHSGGDPGTDALACLDRETGAALFWATNVTGGPELRAFQKEVVLRELELG